LEKKICFPAKEVSEKQEIPTLLKKCMILVLAAFLSRQNLIEKTSKISRKGSS
jgi:hypothetical protein